MGSRPLSSEAKHCPPSLQAPGHPGFSGLHQRGAGRPRGQLHTDAWAPPPTLRLHLPGDPRHQQTPRVTRVRPAPFPLSDPRGLVQFPPCRCPTLAHSSSPRTCHAPSQPSTPSGLQEQVLGPPGASAVHWAGSAPLQGPPRTPPGQARAHAAHRTQPLRGAGTGPLSEPGLARGAVGAQAAVWPRPHTLPLPRQRRLRLRPGTGSAGQQARPSPTAAGVRAAPGLRSPASAVVVLGLGARAPLPPP